MENISFPKNLIIIFSVIFCTAHTKQTQAVTKRGFNCRSWGLPLHLSPVPTPHKILHDLKSKDYMKIHWYMKLSSILLWQILDL